ncbi:membrane protein [Arenibacter certesii]|uniref:Membrane protein n=2 Tax=Arenibacter certesii TaxID=228955 RepID=A0A918IRM4_9FLAO|nr:membrane protein [Arenibacter certesii]
MIMNNYRTIQTVIVLLSLSFWGCNDNLTIDPEQYLNTEKVISTSENLNKILNNAYGTARASSSYGGGINLASELIGNGGDLSWNGTYVGPAEFNEKAMLPDNGFVEDIWMNGYSVINQANIVIENLEVYTDPDEKSTKEGEAKFLRGLIYFDLGRLFSKPFNASAPNTQLAVPITLAAVIDPYTLESPARNTLDEVFNRVVTDLTDAYNKLPASNSFYANKYSAAALLARVYLDMGMYDKARDMADEVIRESGASLTGDFAGAFNNDSNSSENLFAWQVTSQDVSINDNNTFWAGRDFGGRSGNPDVSIEDQHLEIYDDPNDQRANFFYQARGMATTKWKSQFGNISFIRLAEMYLIRAESNFRLSTSIGTTPISDINTLRMRSSAATYLIAIDLETILKERKRELAFEGFALFDAKRLGNEVGSIPHNANNLVLPIPQRETDANTNLVQNDGY